MHYTHEKFKNRILDLSPNFSFTEYSPYFSFNHSQHIPIFYKEKKSSWSDLEQEFKTPKQPQWKLPKSPLREVLKYH